MYAVKAKFSVKPLANMVIPPFSSKISRTLLINVLKEASPTLVRSFASSESQKPVRVTPLFYKDYPLVKSEKDNKILMLRENVEYEFSSSIIGEKIVAEIVKLASLTPFKIEAFTKKFALNLVNVEVKGFELMGLKLCKGERIGMRFVTPTLLQLPRVKNKEWGNKQVHILFPALNLIFWSLISHWNKFAPTKLRVTNVKKLVTYSNYSLIMVDHKIKPFTVVYDEKRRPRGFVGWALYKFEGGEEEFDKQLLRLLDYANYVGIGRSKSIGFGVVNISPSPISQSTKDV